MPGSSAVIAPVNGTGTKSEATYVSVTGVFATIAAGITSSGIEVAGDCAFSGVANCDETSFVGAGEDCPLDRPMTDQTKTSSTAAAAPTLVHCKLRRQEARR